MNRIFDYVDSISIKLFAAFVASGTLNIVWPNNIMGWIALLAGCSTIFYNVIRSIPIIVKYLKNKKNAD